MLDIRVLRVVAAWYMVQLSHWTDGSDACLVWRCSCAGSEGAVSISTVGTCRLLILWGCISTRLRDLLVPLVSERS